MGNQKLPTKSFPSGKVARFRLILFLVHTARLTGTVFYENGLPMAGIQAAAIPDQGHRKNPQRFKSETTAQYGRLERAAGGAYEVAKDGDVGTVDTDAAGVHRET